MTNEKRAHCYHDFAYNVSTATRKILSAFKVNSLEVFELQDKNSAICAAGGLLEYLAQTQKRSLGQLTKISFLHDKSFMMLDNATRRNLELTQRARDGKRQGSLLSVLDKTATAMGARTLKRWIEQPLQDADSINKRLDAVEDLMSSKALRERLGEAFYSVRDLERLNGRLAYGNASPKDLLSISDTLEAIPQIKQLLSGATSQLVKGINKALNSLETVCATLQSALDREGVNSYKNGGYVKKGYDETLDQMRDIKNSAKEWLANLEAREREETGIRTLKVGYNKVFGYYIEVSKSFADKVPYRYERKQTLVNGERYITDELKQLEEKYFRQNPTLLRSKTGFCGTQIDVLRQSCKTSIERTSIECARLFGVPCKRFGGKQVRKTRNQQKIKCIDIEEGRHPVVETLLDRGAYVPNDTLLDDSDNRTMIITGPNMAGKSTYMRQVAIITLMAHIGCFVPAKSAKIALTDRIFTRIGASDDLSGGQSTFMVEMIEVATILNYATSSSLLVLDEIGRGTSTFDGLSIAWAVLEYITKTSKQRRSLQRTSTSLPSLKTSKASKTIAFS